MAKGRKRKPIVEEDITCPECKSVLHIKVHKIRTNEPVKPEYSFNTDIDTKKQGELFADYLKKNTKKKKKTSVKKKK